MRLVVVAVLALVACKKDKQTRVAVGSGTATPSDGALVAPADAPAASTPSWELRTKPVDLGCAAPAPVTGAYDAALDAGRTAGKAKRWADAVAAFERALVVQPDDPAALAELAWATLQAGDAKRALELAERAIAGVTEPNPKAASHFAA
ncbi:MAG TPA: tetratricopeptide repeat protein, partial [Kofleriaceae bacterium]|nr:tetratricopeptide repeat protein [Kofleriaceae bacterium]